MRDMTNQLARPFAAPKKKTARNKNERADIEALQQAGLFSRTSWTQKRASTFGESPMLQLFQVSAALPGKAQTRRPLTADSTSPKGVHS